MYTRYNFFCNGKSKLLLLIAAAMLQILFFSCKDTLDEDNSDDSGETDPQNESTIGEAESNNSLSHEEDADYVWSESDEELITLNGSSVSTDADGVTVDGTIVKITSAGNYRFSGTLNDGQIYVNTEDESIVRLILDGVNITCSNSSAIYIKSAEKVLIDLASDSKNYLTDSSSYDYDDAEDEEPNATVFSKSDLTIWGDGSLSVTGKLNDGITSKDGLIIANGNITVDAVDDGIRGKDYLIIKDGEFSIDAGGDGFKSDNDNDESLGFITITYADITITSVGDAITAETDVMIEDGNFELKTTGVSTSSNDISAKGIKAGVNIITDSGTFNITSTDDAVHSNETITINGGDFTISTGDDGIHADYDLTINGGDINITKSYEGVESASGDIIINDGTVRIVSSDDGINVSAGGDSMGGGGGFGRSSSSSSGSYFFYMNGGYVYINASGDGVDSNDSVEMTGGTLIVDGPTLSNNGALDYDGSFKLSGGFLLAVGSSGMAQAPGSSSSQYIVAVTLSSSQNAGTVFHIEDSSENSLVTFKPAKKYQTVVFSSSELSKGSSYNFYLGGSSTGTATDGLYSDGAYSGGTKYTSFTISAIITSTR